LYHDRPQAIVIQSAHGVRRAQNPYNSRFAAIISHPPSQPPQSGKKITSSYGLPDKFLPGEEKSLFFSKYFGGHSEKKHAKTQLF